MTIPSNIREELIRLAKSHRTRQNLFNRAQPTVWDVRRFYDPDTKEPFTDDAAWARIVTELQSGCKVEVITLKKPPGKPGYVLKFKDHRGTLVYVKLQLGSGLVFGRSFHEDGRKQAS